MKTLQTTLITLVLILATAGFGFAQTIHIVNPAGIPEGANNFDTLQEAVDAASDGDIIHVIASSSPYPKLELSKSLQIIGQGFLKETSIEGIDLLDGASGTLIDGFYFRGPLTIKGDVGGLAVRNCIFVGGGITPRPRLILEEEASVAGLLIQNNIFNTRESSGEASRVKLGTDNNHQNVIIANNIFTNTAGASGGDISVGNQTQVSFNIFYGGSGTTSNAFVNVRNSSIENNIFIGKRVQGNPSVSNSEFNHNIIFEASPISFPIGSNNNTGTGNIEGQDPQFVDLEPSTSAWNFTWDATLEESSPAIGAATDGTDMGLFGGLNPFNMRGASLPEILQIAMPNFVGAGQDVEVNIKARGN